MLALKEIKEKLKTTARIRMITKTYQEVADKKMREIRQHALNNREFIEQLFQVYILAKRAYNLIKKTEKNRKIYPKEEKQGKVAVFLSSNEHFQGSLILDIWKKVSGYLSENKSDLAIVGNVGRYLSITTNPKRKFFYFDLDDDNPKKDEVKKIINFIKKYKEVIIFYGKFNTVLTQEIAQINISGEISTKEEIGTTKKYLFEPSPKAILEFFETELMSAFLNQTILEHRLSRYATRMVAMYQSTKNAEKETEQLKKERKKLKRRLLNKKLIELFSGFLLWK